MFDGKTTQLTRKTKINLAVLHKLNQLDKEKVETALKKVEFSFFKSKNYFLFEMHIKA